MKNKKLNLYEIVSVLVNGGYILQKRPILFGPCEYLVHFPDKNGASVLGYITESVMCGLWDSGLIIGKDVLKQDGGFYLNTFILYRCGLDKIFESLKVG